MVFVNWVLFGVQLWRNRLFVLVLLAREGKGMPVFEVERGELVLVIALPVAQTHDVLELFLREKDI